MFYCRNPAIPAATESPPILPQFFIIALLPIIGCYTALQRYYIPTAREVARIESVSRSPIYSDLAEAVAGVPTIRAYRVGPYFVEKCDQRIVANTAAWITQKIAAEWLNVRLRLLGTAVGVLAAFLVISGGVAPSLAGLVLLYGLDVTKYMEHGTAMASDTESKMNSVERIKVCPFSRQLWSTRCAKGTCRAHLSIGRPLSAQPASFCAGVR